MFGYVIPNICDLKVFEHEIYKATYCGLCKHIKKNFGSLCRLNLSYDMVFLAIFLICYNDEKIEFEKKICLLHPFKKRLFIKKSYSLEQVSNISTILFYYKLKDNFYDCKNLKKILSLVFLLVFKGAHKKARNNEKEIENLTYRFIKEQEKVEKQNKKSLDYYCHPTASYIGKIFTRIINNKKEEASLYRIGYMLGKYIYLMDALDDFFKDKKTGNFNPFIEQNQNLEDIFKTANSILNLTIAQLQDSFKKIFKSKNTIILNNIIYQGLFKQKSLILTKLKNNKVR